MSQVNSTERKRIVTHLAEFFVVGLAMGIVGDLLAIHFATDARLLLKPLRSPFGSLYHLP